MRGNPHTEGDFDRLMITPFCLGIFLIGLGIWWLSWQIALAGLGITGFGVLLILLVKPTNFADW